MRTKTQTSRTLTGILLTGLLFTPLVLLSGCNNQPDTAETSSNLMRAETYAEQGQYRSAMVEIRNAIQAEPNQVSHVVRLAQIYQTIGAHEPASELLEPWLGNEADAVALPLARSYVERGKHLSALETLEAWSPGSEDEQLEASLIRAEALRLSGETTQALELFEGLLADQPASEHAITGIARSYLDLNQPTQTIERVDEWSSNNLAQAEPLYWKGMAQYQQNQLELASESLIEAVGALPGSDFFLPIRGSILTALSRVLTEQGQIAEAQVYNRILAENTNSGAREQGQAAIAAIREGNIDEAKTILQDMLKLNPDNDQAALMLGALAASTGELEEGTRLLTENLDPETTPTRFIRAATMAQIDTGDREEALKTLERSIQARPNDNELLSMYGVLALSLPDYQEAGVASLSKAIANEPDRVRLRLALAQHYQRQQQPEQALGQLRMAFTANPADWNTTASYLNLLLQQGETAEAQDIRDSLLNGYPDDPSAMLLASMADAQLGNTETAQKRLESLVKDSPELQAPTRALAMLYAQSGQNEEAVKAMIAAARLTPEAMQPLQQAVQVYAQEHSVEAVKQWLGTLGEEHPELNENADVLSALINIRQGDLAQARSMLEPWQTSESGPVRRATAELLGAEAVSATNSADYATARAKAAEAIALQPDSLSLALIPVRTAALETDNQYALEVLDGVETTFGEQSAIVRARAQLFGRDNRPEEAMSILRNYYQKTSDLAVMPDLIAFATRTQSDQVDTLTQEWTAKAPNNAAAGLARADYLMQQGNGIEAGVYYERVLEQQPENITALNNLAWTLRERDRDRALSLAKRASELAPQSGAILDTFGWILHLDGQQQAAAEQLRKAVELEPENAEIAQHLEEVQNAL